MPLLLHRVPLPRLGFPRDTFRLSTHVVVMQRCPHDLSEMHGPHVTLPGTISVHRTLRVFQEPLDFLLLLQELLVQPNACR